MGDAFGAGGWRGGDSFVMIGENDRRYDTEESVPDVTLYERHWVERSAQARAELGGALDLRYGPTRDEYLDVFPAERPGSPVMVFFHGGWWRVGSARDFSYVAKGFVPNGVTTVVVNYALCPHVSIDEIARQARAAVAWVYRSIGDHNGDPNRIHLSGHSAGAHLTALCMETDWSRYEMPRDVIKSGVLISGVFDLRPIRYTFLQPWLQLDSGVIERNSPQLHQPADTDAPMLIVAGDGDPEAFRDQSRDYHALWIASGNTGDHLELPGANHFDVTWGLEHPDGDLVSRILATMDGR